MQDSLTGSCIFTINSDMNKKFIYLILIAVFFATTAFVVFKYNAGVKNEVVAFYPIKERTGGAAALPEWAAIKTKGADLVRIVRETPEDTKSALALATLYIQEARVTGNYAYYDKAATKYIDDILKREPKNFEALVLKALLQLSQHHFSEALITAETARAINPHNAFIYGIMVDGSVEMGTYKKAVEYADRMISIRPDLRSYARVAYLREIHGDYTGAIEAMKLAVDAGSYGDEQTAWAEVQLAKLYENTGDIKNAEMHYTIALDQRRGYGLALAGLGSIAAINNEYDKAIRLYGQADSALNDYGIKESLAKLYMIKGDTKKANAIINTIINDLTKASEEGEESINHHADKELSSVYLLKNDPDKALKHALAEYSRRPDNIDVAQTVGWAYYKNSEAKKAIPFIEKALGTNSKNPVLLSQAGLIYAAVGNKNKAKNFLQQAVANNTVVDPDLKKEVSIVFEALNK